MTVNTSELTQKILKGFRLKRGDDLAFFLSLPLEELQQGAHDLQEHFCGQHVDLCTIINGRCGHCSENCRYCAQSAHNHAVIDEHPFLPIAEILENARLNQDAGANRFAIVTSGRALDGADFEKVLEAYREMHRTLTIGLCASHGILSAQQLHRIHETGVTSYHHNIETSRRFFPEICTTHTYDDRIRTIRLAQEEGLSVCSGGIIGMGETWEDRLDMAISLAELGIQSIPINALMPIPGTPMEGRPQLSGADILRTVAIFRFINPEANIRLAAGRKLLPKNGETAFQTGASASITGNMLTTSGTTIKEDMEMLQRLGMNNR